MHSILRLARSLRLRVLLGTVFAASLACDGSDKAPNEDAELSISITSPLGTAYVRDAVMVQIVVNDGTPDTVELLQEGNVLAKLVAPYQYTWDTAHVPEGRYLLTARARRGTSTAVSSDLVVMVDRTPPELVSRTPTPGSPEEWTGRISFSASEPLAATSITDGSVQLRVGARPIRTRRNLSGDGRTVDLIIDEPLTLPAEMTLDVRARVSDLAGNLLIVPATAWSWQAPAWRLMGTSLHATSTHHAGSSRTSLIVLPGGQPVVAFEEWLTGENSTGNPINQGLVVTQWDGTDWSRIGPSGAKGQGRLALGPDAAPYLAWSAGSDIHLRRRQGTAWASLHESLDGGPTGTTNIHLSVTPEGRVGVARATNVVTQGTLSSVFLAGSEPWKEVLSSFKGRIFALAMGPYQRTWVVYQRTDSNELRVMSLEGNQISEIGGALQDTSGTLSPASAADLKIQADGTPVVAWRDEASLHVQRWNAITWENVGTPLDAGHGSASEYAVSLALTPEDSAPVVAWVYRSRGLGDGDLRVMAWNGSDWEARLSGVPANPYVGPALALQREGRTVVAWQAPPEDPRAPSQDARSHSTLRVRANY